MNATHNTSETFTTTAAFNQAFNTMRDEICARLAPGKDSAKVRLTQVIKMQIMHHGSWANAETYKTDMIDRMRTNTTECRLVSLV